jgi:hypothetical protein
MGPPGGAMIAPGVSPVTFETNCPGQVAPDDWLKIVRELREWWFHNPLFTMDTHGTRGTAPPRLRFSPTMIHRRLL